MNFRAATEGNESICWGFFLSGLCFLKSRCLLQTAQRDFLINYDFDDKIRWLF